MFKLRIFTLFPGIFPANLDASILKKAREENKWSMEVVDIRKYGIGKHRKVDDTPYGGGAGMVLRSDVLAESIEDNLIINDKTKIIMTSPRGRLFNQKIAKELSELDEINIICGRFEGVDQRVIDYYKMDEISIGDYVLLGGEVASLVIAESCIRLIPGVLGNAETLHEESFAHDTRFANLLEYNQYTKPSNWRSLDVPSVLLSGNHMEIDNWRMNNAQEITKQKRITKL